MEQIWRSNMVEVFKVINGTMTKIGTRDIENLFNPLPDFDGADYESEKDHERLSGQIKRVFDLMQDGQWRILDEIASATGDPHASISAQLRNLRKDKFGAYEVVKRPRSNRESGLFEYRLIK